MLPPTLVANHSLTDRAAGMRFPDLRMPEHQVDRDTIAREVGRRILDLKGGESMKAFSRRVGIPVSTLNNYGSGQSGPSLYAIVTVVLNTDVNPAWLLTGEGAEKKSEALDPQALREVLTELRKTLVKLEETHLRSPGRHARTPRPKHPEF